jgi:hypothetical protein
MLKEVVVSLVENSVSSIFSKDDVLKLLAFIEAEKPAAAEKKFSQKFRDDLNNAISQRVDNLCAKDMVEDSSFEFEVYGNELSVTDFDVDSSYITNEIWDEVVDFLDNYEEEESATETE